MNNFVILCIIVISIIVVGIIIWCLFRDSFENINKILKSPFCAHSGLGDRIAQYIIFSTLGKIYNCKVLVFWNTTNKNWSSRGNEYPHNIQDYIKFPDNLKFVTQKEWKNNKIDNIFGKVKLSYFYHGEDLVPEIVYKKLNLSKYIKLEDYLKLYKETAKQISYKKELPKLPNNFVGVHVRRGDKTRDSTLKRPITYHNDRLNKVFNKLNIDDYVLCSEGDNPIKGKQPITIKLSNDKMIRTLQEFFILSKARIIIQSIPGDTRWGGWTSFSYVASRIGDSVLYNCSPEGTRLYYMENIAGRKLYNVVKYSDLM